MADHWERVSKGASLPYNAVMALDRPLNSNESAEFRNAYVARWNHSGETVFGRAHTRSGRLEAYFPWGGGEHSPSTFEILVRSPPGQPMPAFDYRWLRVSELPQARYEFSPVGGEDCAPCVIDVKHFNGAHGEFLGKINLQRGMAWMSYGGKEGSFHADEQYRGAYVLCRKQIQVLQYGGAFGNAYPSVYPSAPQQFAAPQYAMPAAPLPGFAYPGPIMTENWQQVYARSSLPYNAVMALDRPLNNNEPHELRQAYVARWNKDGETVFGRAHTRNGQLEAYFPWGGGEHSPDRFDILINNPGTYRWLRINELQQNRYAFAPVNGDEMAPCVVSVSNFNGARGEFLGKINVQRGMAWISYGGKEGSFTDSQYASAFVLCRNSR